MSEEAKTQMQEVEDSAWVSRWLVEDYGTQTNSESSSSKDALTPEGKKPKPFHILSDVVSGILRPRFSDECPQRIRSIGLACCQHDPARRPTAAQVVRMLEGAD
ncbi:hypothetical protein PF005_g17524 [Phytophthora fragariae]|uniref:Serine-threonine/tyrosine-protein kinase catalytic domain-containing protein n=1 Tax=Phytophthora fragariae TaxID=53985 RepID=A0A6A3X449_9STRA|nr:hypothetical protein PF005_g17524 [Phytophthora fragariae]